MSKEFEALEEPIDEHIRDGRRAMEEDRRMRDEPFVEALADPEWRAMWLSLHIRLAYKSFKTPEGEFSSWVAYDGRPRGVYSQILTREEIQELLVALHEFYSHVSDDQIRAYNEEIRQYHFVIGEPRRRTLSPNRVKQHGFVYIIQAVSGQYKIGRAKNVQKRLKQLQTASPNTLTLIHTIASNDYEWTELSLHERFDDDRLDGEWFDLDDQSLAWLKSQQRLDSE